VGQIPGAADGGKKTEDPSADEQFQLFGLLLLVEVVPKGSPPAPRDTLSAWGWRRRAPQASRRARKALDALGGGGH
jgi:hypothetical protein